MRFVWLSMPARYHGLLAAGSDPSCESALWREQSIVIIPRLPVTDPSWTTSTVTSASWPAAGSAASSPRRARRGAGPSHRGRLRPPRGQVDQGPPTRPGADQRRDRSLMRGVSTAPSSGGGRSASGPYGKPRPSPPSLPASRVHEQVPLRACGQSLETMPARARMAATSSSPPSAVEQRGTQSSPTVDQNSPASSSCCNRSASG